MFCRSYCSTLQAAAGEPERSLPARGPGGGVAPAQSGRPRPRPGSRPRPGLYSCTVQVWVRVLASGICGSDIRAIYRQHQACATPL